MADKGKPPLGKRDIAVKGTVMASIITIPSLAGFFAAWALLDDALLAAGVGAVIHFVALGFSFKISKRLLVR